MNAPAPRLLIGTPAYGGMMHSDCVSALLQYQRAGIDFALMSIGNESLITRARNTILSEFHARSGFTHLLFLDADVLLPPAGLRRLLASGRDVIGAAVTLIGGTLMLANADRWPRLTGSPETPSRSREEWAPCIRREPDIHRQPGVATRRILFPHGASRS